MHSEANEANKSGRGARSVANAERRALEAGARTVLRTPFGPGSEARPCEDDVVVEEPLEIRIGAAPIAVVMRTPGRDEELVRGFLLTERIVESPDQIGAVRHCDRRDGSATGDDRADGRDASGVVDNVMRASLRSGVRVDLERLRRNFYASSSCGVCGKATLDQVLSWAPRLADATRFDPDAITRIGLELARHQPLFARTGGLHAAGLFTAQGDALVVREDIGRHNAVDKVVGWAAANGALPLAGRVLAVSGRVSFEIVQKALAARIPLIAAVSAPSSLAINLAEAAHIGLVAFLRGPSFSLYGSRERVVLPAAVAGP